MSDALTPYVTSESGQEVGEKKRFVGIRVCSLLYDQIAPLRPHFDPAMGASGTWPGGTGGMFQPRITKYTLKKRDAARWQLVIYYTTPETSQLVSPSVGFLRVQISGRGCRMKRETTDLYRIIEGPEDGDSSKRWVVVKGENTCYLSDGAHLILDTASESPSVDTFLSDLDKVNDAPLPNFLNAPAETIKFIGVEFDAKLIGQGLYYEHLHFIYRREWTCWVKQQERVVKKATDPQANVPGRTFLAWADAVGVNSEIRTTHSGTTSFAKWNSLLTY